MGHEEGEDKASLAGSGAVVGELARRNRELVILNVISEALNRSADLEQALNEALARVVELLDLSTGWIWLLDPGTNAPYVAASLNLPPALADHPRRLEGRCYCLDTFQAGDLEGAANINVVACSRLPDKLPGTRGFRYHASIPLYAQGERLGVLNVASQNWRELEPEELRLLHTISDLLGIAIERTRLAADSRRLGAAEERNRLAREIHDTLAQQLTGLIMQLESAEALLEVGATQGASAPVSRALVLGRRCLDEARRSVMDLRAAPLEGRSLDEALAALAASHQGEGEPGVVISLDGARRPLSPRLECGLYRLAQEGLENAVRHAGASRISLELSASASGVLMEITDDGRGFDPQVLPPGRYGLIGMNERAALLGGRLRVASSPGHGTRLSFHVPLTPQES